MRTPIHRLAAVLVALAAAVALTVAVVAQCSGPASADDADPPAWGPTYGGVLYCGYQFTPLECAGHPGIPMLMPTVAPPQNTLLWALYLHEVMYHGYYWSPRRYDTVLVRYHVGGTRQAFVSSGRSFNSRNASYERTYTRTTSRTVTTRSGGGTTQRRTTTTTQQRSTTTRSRR